MLNIRNFLKENPHLLLFGVLLTFFSSYGQTFLISLYLPSLERVFAFSNTGLSSFYALATTASALTLPWVGRLIDTQPLARFTFGVLFGLAIACLLLSLAVHPVMVLIGFYGLRLFGQGLMSHTSISTMARAFDVNRGKAISTAILGHPIGESILPLLITLAIAALGWRGSLQLSALSVVVFVVPMIYFLLRQQPRSIRFPPEREPTADEQSPNPIRVLGLRVFWLITPAVFILGFLNTALFFFQLKLGASRGWDPTWVAGSLSVYAASSALATISAGPLVDRLSARQLFPVMLIPYLFGTLLLAYFSHPLSYPVALILLGISNGSSGTIKNALFAEVFGIRIIGTVRSVFTMVMVFSTALGPLTFGLLLDAGWTYGGIFYLAAGVLALIILESALAQSKLRH